MEPILIGAGVTGVAIYAIYWSAKHQSAQVKQPAAVKGAKGRKGSTARRPARAAWLVKVYNSTGATKLSSPDLHGASAELAGRAISGTGRMSRRRWKALEGFAQRSRARREQQWQASGRQPLLFRRTPKPAAPAATVAPTTATPPRTAPADPASPTTTPGPEPPPRRLQAVPDLPKTSGDPVTATADATSDPTALAAPDTLPDWALLAERIRNFNPESDTALIAFMRGESTGILAYAQAMEQARENCVNEVGLDPSAVAGLISYSEHVSDAAQRMSEAYKMFVAVYGEVLQLAANGVVMPHRGRFFTGEAG